MNRREFFVLSAALASRLAIPAAAASEQSIDVLAQITRAGVVPGAALVASRRGRVRLRQAVGICSRVGRREAPLTPETRHPLYSFSKLITGTVVALAVTEGRVSYDDPVSRHIPGFRGGGKESVTIRHCLTHAAGLATVPSRAVHDAEGWNRALADLCAATVEWVPGSRTAYHGWSGAFLAAECVRRAWGLAPWPALCREKLFDPLGARSLSYELPADAVPVAIVPRPAADQPVPGTAAAAFGYAGQPGAGCLGTLDDALRVLHFHLQQGVWHARRLIDRDVFRQMHTVQYSREIAAARAAGEKPRHESWGLGPLLRGVGPAEGGHQWFGFANRAEPGTFGHAGIDTLIGVADPKRRVAFLFATTDSPRPSDRTVPLRNRVTDGVFAELG